MLVVAVLPLAGTILGAAAQIGTGCADFDAYEWAQAVFDADPVAYAGLDPDGDGIACSELPNGAAPALWTDAIPATAEPANLVRIVDGDTIEVALADGAVEAVRLILINTPETVDPNRPDECFGAEATAFAAFLFGLGGDLFLQRDVSERDRFGRLLRYAWLDFGGGEVYLINEALVRSGYAELSTFPPDVAYEAEIRDAQRFAREYGLGLWSACGEVGVPASDEPAAPAPVGVVAPPGPAAPAAVAPAGVPAPAAAQSSSGTCNSSYPTLCLPTFPDLDCGEIADRRFPVVPPDPHGFDGDGDGVGCESG